MLIATIYPWMTITVFFLPQALKGGMLELPWEIIWANLAPAIGISIAHSLEQASEEVEYRPSLQWVIVLVFALALLTYIVFSFFPPEHFFESPEGYAH